MAAPAPELDDDEVRRWRARAQRLDHRARVDGAGVADVVGAVGGVQAQVPAAGALAVRARSGGLTAADVEHARLGERSIVRTWCQRGTFHLVASADLHWMLEVLGPLFVAAARSRMLELGLDEAASAAGVAAIAEALATAGPLTRAELGEHVRRRGIHAPAGSQGMAHLVRRAALEGRLCVGPDRDGVEAYVPLDDWLVGWTPLGEPDDGPARLARRYLEAFSPARPEDLAAWSGLPLTGARSAWRDLADELVEGEVRGRPAWALASPAPTVPRDRAAGKTPSVRLLGAFDTYLLGYRGRELAVDTRLARKVHPGGGWVHPTVAIDGRVVATWNMERASRRWTVTVDGLAGLDPPIAEAVEAEVTDLGRFLTIPTTLTGAGGQ